MEEIYRNYDNKHSINNHSVRIFDISWFGKIHVDRCTDVGYYVVSEMPFGFKLDHEIYHIGSTLMKFDNMSWPKAIEMINQYIEEIYNLA